MSADFANSLWFSAERVNLGRINKTFGLKGEIIISLYDSFADYYNEEDPVFVVIDDIPVPLFFKFFETRGKTKATVIFDDFENENRATELVGKEFFIFVMPEDQDNNIEKTSNDDDDEIYYEDFIGFKILFSGINKEGVIKDYYEDEFNPLFNVLIDEKETLIPVNDHFIDDINIKSKTLKMTIPDGLLDIND